MTRNRSATPTEPPKLIPPMIERFVATDRALRCPQRSDTHSVPRAAERSG
ncbi:DUF2274 domain-containing protein [Bradyrhizobium sp. GCM10027634]|uniref:DUF2274 domain-containing protein n=1 Tax=Bradyrhizobium zhengyangense TaxID=2911009 RepID=A0A9X1RKQ0_9BRAD|nr:MULTISPECIES: DUF2274 domain-containing protein [Bradyrhizobium]MCG2632888.1 DUF2274 domain-containing protein [Bradyrhizobium zhengyangense]MCG2645501.1 DUF2274 domain-containing protein [Bradyrhizobium zhengyangense]MCG2673060.1 DUF2274 domain-containing protein [Bradyrhizobium zhengyangense]MDN4984412.1 DUF2274 domain-containing protein [Bradyrhizobium sp. WYCCWR 13022]MDN5002405.1 DUF2274 domain-containing protein [Bradyrhizobium sp. WYCCWR 12677]